ncbi:MAG: hypothetical protein OEU40_01230, partial [Gammaproteobacteria bacterium]|nr:hypothetical protein [Gammaproteobacteria bacterium]
MRYTTGHRWIELLGWLADRPQASAIAATLLLALVAALIRPPVIEGLMVDQLSGSTERLEIARRITAATGATSVAVVIVSPANASIAATFDDLAALRMRLLALDDGIAVRSIDAAREQLFLYGLTPDRPVTELLAVLRDNPQSTTIVNTAATRFLIVITAPESQEQHVTGLLEAHDWGSTYAEHAVLARAQLEHDVAAGLRKDLRLLLPVIVAATLAAVFLAFGYWRALLLPLFASVASVVVLFSLFSTMVVTINLVTLLALPIVLVVGLANSCHFLAKSGSVR